MKYGANIANNGQNGLTKIEKRLTMQKLLVFWWYIRTKRRDMVISFGPSIRAVSYQ